MPPDKAVAHRLIWKMARKGHVLKDRLLDAFLDWNLSRVVVYLTDSALILVAFALAYWIRFRTGLPVFDETGQGPLLRYGYYSLVGLLFWLFWFSFFGVYLVQHSRLIYGLIAAACTAATLSALFIRIFGYQFAMSFGWLALSWFFTFVLTAAARFVSVRPGWKTPVQRTGLAVAGLLLVAGITQAIQGDRTELPGSAGIPATRVVAGEPEAISAVAVQPQAVRAIRVPASPESSTADPDVNQAATVTLSSAPARLVVPSTLTVAAATADGMVQLAATGPDRIAPFEQQVVFLPQTLAAPLAEAAAAARTTLQPDRTGRSMRTLTGSASRHRQTRMEEPGNVGDQTGAVPVATAESVPVAPALKNSETAPTPAPAMAVVVTVQAPANVRAGPGFGYTVVGFLSPGDQVTVVAQDVTGEWRRLQDGNWVYAGLVRGAPVTLPVSSGQ